MQIVRFLINNRCYRDVAQIGKTLFGGGRLVQDKNKTKQNDKIDIEA